MRLPSSPAAGDLSAVDLSAGGALTEPLDELTAARLRRIVFEHACAIPRRSRTPLVYAGLPDAHSRSVAERPGEPLDHGLRADVVAALVAAVRGRLPEPPWVWLVRPGGLGVDVDAAWLAASRQAYAELGLPLTFVVADRRGWYDPRSGVRRTWVRARRRSPGH